MTGRGPGSPTDEEVAEALFSRCETVEDKKLVEAALPGLTKHFRLLYAWNQRINLTAIRDEPTGLQRHLVEAIAPLPLLVPRAGQRLVDLGSGNGYPALALLLCWPELRGLLIERVARKVDFLRAVIRSCDLGDRVEVREQNLTNVEQLPDDASIVTMRAFPRPAEWVTHALERDQTQCVIAWLSDVDIDAMLPVLQSLREPPRCERRATGPGRSILVASSTTFPRRTD